MREKIINYLWIALGFLCFGLGTFGVVLPVLPTVPFYMATVYWISRSEIQIHLGDFWIESIFRNAHVIVEYTKTTD